MRVLSVKEPWATLILERGKNIENRSTNIADSYRGPVAIHTSAQAAHKDDPDWQIAASVGFSVERRSHRLGSIIGVVELFMGSADSGCELASWMG